MGGKNLLLGKNGSEEISSDWINVDKNPASSDLVSEMQQQGLIPSSNFKLIVCNDCRVYSKTQLLQNVHALLSENGLFIIANLKAYDIISFSEYFKGAIIRLPGITLFAKSPRSFNEIAMQLTTQTEAHAFPKIVSLIQQLGKLQRLSAEYELDNSHTHQQMAVLYNLLDMIAFDSQEEDIAGLEQIKNALQMILIKKTFTDLYSLIVDVCKKEPELAACFNHYHWDKELSEQIAKGSNETPLNFFYSVLALSCVLEPALIPYLESIDYTQRFNWKRFGFFTALGAAGLATVAAIGTTALGMLSKNESISP